jgi:hypothetical protein
MAYDGGCLCGAVRFRLDAEPYRVGVCHCMNCRKTHGAVFRTFAMFPAEALTLTGATARFELPAGTFRHFCSRCGSPVFERVPDPAEIEIYVGALDEPNRLKPTYELWLHRRESWLPELPVVHRYKLNREGKGRTET